MDASGREYTVEGSVQSVVGKVSQIKIPDIQDRRITSIQMEDLSGQSQTEEQQSLKILQFLQNKADPRGNTWMELFYTTQSCNDKPTIDEAVLSTDSTWALEDDPPFNVQLHLPPVTRDIRTSDSGSKVGGEHREQSQKSATFHIPISDALLGSLNPSQCAALNDMLGSTKVTVVQGPPGTGKTTVISSFVECVLQNSEHTLWLTAQSNVAVKNIALKLKQMSLLEWKILVSSEYFNDWYASS